MAKLFKSNPAKSRVKTTLEDRIMERTRAAVALTSGGSEAEQLAAFMGIFHPNYPRDKTQSMIVDARERDRRRR
jgi:hypothetical protein